MSVPENVSYVSVCTKIYWIEDHSVWDLNLIAYWLYEVTSLSSGTYASIFFEIQNRNNSTRTGKYEDIDFVLSYMSNVATTEEPGLLATQLSNYINYAVISNAKAIRAFNIFYINQGPAIAQNPPPVLLARKSSYYTLEGQIRPSRVDVSVFMDIRKYTAFSYVSNLIITDNTDGKWVYNYVYAPMFTEFYMPTFEVATP